MPDFALFKNTNPSVVERIIAKAIDLLRTMEDPDNADGDTYSLFKNAERGDPDDHPEWDALRAPFAAVDEGEDSVEGNWTDHGIQHNLILTIHVRFTKGFGGGVDPYTVFRYYLAHLQVLFLSDPRFGGTCTNVQEVSSAPQVFTQDNLQGGYLTLQFTYRTPKEDPFNQR